MVVRLLARLAEVLGARPDWYKRREEKQGSQHGRILRCPIEIILNNEMEK
jgi:hypothetical protein